MDFQIFNVWECCGIDRPTTPPPNGCPFSVGCFDIFSHKIYTYGSSFIALLVVNCVSEVKKKLLLTNHCFNLSIDSAYMYNKEKCKAFDNLPKLDVLEIKRLSNCIAQIHVEER